MRLVIAVELEGRSRHRTLALLCNASRTWRSRLTRKLNSFRVQAYQKHVHTYVRASSPLRRRRHTREQCAARFCLKSPPRLPFGLRHTANLHAVMTSCRKTANNKSEQPSYETIRACRYVRRRCNERHSRPTGMRYPVHPVVRCNCCGIRPARFAFGEVEDT